MERIRQFLNKNIYIFSVRQGLLLTIPFLILGSFSMVIMQFPLKAWQFAGGSVKLLLMAVYQATFGSLSFIFALMISYSYGEEQTVYKNTHIFFPAVALCSFIAFTYPSGGLSIWGPELYGHMHYPHQLLPSDRNLPLGGGIPSSVYHGSGL